MEMTSMNHQDHEGRLTVDVEPNRDHEINMPQEPSDADPNRDHDFNMSREPSNVDPPNNDYKLEIDPNYSHPELDVPQDSNSDHKSNISQDPSDHVDPPSNDHESDVSQDPKSDHKSNMSQEPFDVDPNYSGHELDHVPQDPNGDHELQELSDVDPPSSGPELNMSQEPSDVDPPNSGHELNMSQEPSEPSDVDPPISGHELNMSQEPSDVDSPNSGRELNMSRGHELNMSQEPSDVDPPSSGHELNMSQVDRNISLTMSSDMYDLDRNMSLNITLDPVDDLPNPGLCAFDDITLDPVDDLPNPGLCASSNGFDDDPYLLVNRGHELNEREPFEPTNSTTTPTEPTDITNRALFVAALKGEWEKAEEIIDSDNNLLTATISMDLRTVLHVAAGVGRSQFVENLVERLDGADLVKQDAEGMTALHYAIISGITRPAKAMLTKHTALTQITSKQGYTPLLISILSSNKEMVWYLSFGIPYDDTSNPFTGPLAGQIICEITAAGFHDIALCLLEDYPDLIIAKDRDNYSILRVLAGQPSAFLSGNGLGFWRRYCVYPFVPVELNNHPPPHLLQDETTDPPENSGWLARLVPTLLRWETILSQVLGIKQVHDEKLRHITATVLGEKFYKQLSIIQIPEFHVQAILITATRNGIVEIVSKFVQHFPDLIGYMDKDQKLILATIEHRREDIFSLLRENTARSMTLVLEDEFAKNSLRLAAKLPLPSRLKCVSGSALQIQRELQWFKEVQNFTCNEIKQSRNIDEETAWDLFLKEHKESFAMGEKWMKDTSNACMLVAILVATIVFAGAFTVPGGLINDKGTPVFLKSTSFTVFVITDALALFSSTISVIVFLSILAARYAEEDFLELLPKRLIQGLASLFFAIGTMMIAFGTALYILLGKRWKWIYIPITLLVCFPGILFVMLQLPSFIQMFQSSYGSGIFRPVKQRIPKPN